MTAIDGELADRVKRALHQVRDPEIPAVDIVELGIVRTIARRGGSVAVTITPTYSGCPAMAVIESDIRRALAGIGLHDVTIETVFAPPWSTDDLTDSAKVKLRASGIAPPVGRGGAKTCARPFEAAPNVPCPHCGSAQTTMISEFGSTACKALYRCDDCREPFDYFKCL